VILHASTTRHDEWDGSRRYVHIAVHNTDDDLRRAAAAYRPGADWTDTAGCFHPADLRLRYDADGNAEDVSDPHYAGLMRLSREHLTTEVVIHETVHAAATIYRMDVCTMIRLENGCGEREETLAYIVGDLSRAIVNALHDGGVW
jgi:hypothetical protein